MIFGELSSTTTTTGLKYAKIIPVTKDRNTYEQKRIIFVKI
jgi:hypothetical protein